MSYVLSTKSLPPPPIEVGWGANLQTDAAKNFLIVPIPAKAKKLCLLSIYKFSLDWLLVLSGAAAYRSDPNLFDKTQGSTT